jgi:lipopolysaccharide transport system ATP-binding protein
VSDWEDESLETFDPGFVPLSTVEYDALGAKITKPCIRRQDGEPINSLISKRRYGYFYEVEFDEAFERVGFGMLIKTVSGLELGGATTSYSPDLATREVARGECITVSFGFRAMMAPGMYFMNAGVLDLTTGKYLHRVLDAVAFRVLPEPKRVATALVDFDVIPLINRF